MSPKASDGFSPQEKAAMRERAKELKAQAKAAQQREVGEAEPDQRLAQRIHELVSTHAPTLWPRTWYGMPAYTKEGKVLCFFQSGAKFESRYCTLGFTDAARLDDGQMWATSFALVELDVATEAQIVALLARATA
jgi:uncharacterized protein YdhG (YjbR/CyaY superfamily)